MEEAARQKLKEFIEDHFDFQTLKKVGFFEKGIRKTDYEKIAARVCLFFGYKSIYEYGKIRFSGILSMGNEEDICGMEPGWAMIVRPNVDMGCPTNWNELRPPEQSDLCSKDKYLN